LHAILILIYYQYQEEFTVKKNAYSFLFEDVISLAPVNIYWKNKHGIYLGCNLRNAMTSGHSPDEVIGKKLEQLFSNSKIVNKINKVDEKVMSRNQIFVGEEPGYDLNGKKTIYFSRKVPLQNSRGEAIGLIGVSIDITNQKNSCLTRKIYKPDNIKKSLFYRGFENKAYSFKKILHQKFNQNQYALPKKYKGIYLTHREVQCLVYLSCDFTAKKIARLLSISYRTVESHLATIKTKLYCRTRAELITTVLEEKLLEKIKLSGVKEKRYFS
jgi:PAS domain S-box-containing protein